MSRYVCLCLLMLVACAVHGAVIHVPSEQPTIQAAIDIAIDNDTILIANGTYTGSGNVDINTLGKAITIQSENGPDLCVIDCAGKARGFIFETNETRTTIIRDMSIINGSDYIGAGIYIKANCSPSIINCVIKNCTSNVNGGGCHVIHPSSPLFDSCKFHDNQAMSSGGGLASDGVNVELSNCEFVRNTAGINAGAAIFFDSNTSAVLSNCIFSDNSAHRCGAVMSTNETTTSLNNCTFTGNHSESFAGACEVDNNSTVTYKNCVFTQNSCTLTGGAINLSESDSFIENCVFTDNESTNGDGGAIACSDTGQKHFANCEFTTNTANSGGAIKLTSDSSTEIESCSFTGNTATYSSGGAIDVNQSSAHIHECTFTRNEAVFNGGAINLSRCDGTIQSNQFSDNIARMAGGAVNCDTVNSIVIGGSPDMSNQFSGNASGAGSTVFAANSPAQLIDFSYNTIDACQASGYAIWPLGDFDMTGCSFSLNPVDQDMYVSQDGDDSNSGLTPDEPFKTIRRALRQVHSQQQTPVTVHLAAGTYSENEIYPLPMLANLTLAGAGMNQTILDAENGSSLLVGQMYENFTLCDLTLVNGYSWDGGCIHSTDSTWTLNRVGIKSNESIYKGGSVRARSSSGMFNHCVFQDNTAGKGGVAFINESNLSFNNCLLTNNHSNSEAGALYSKQSNVSISNCSIVSNTADNDGGALYSEGNPTMNIINSIVWSNSPNQIAGPNLPSATYSNIQDGFVGEGNINADPLFINGSQGHYYLSHTDTGQDVSSPSINSGSTLASEVVFDDIKLIQMTTRTDHLVDNGTVDQGFHYEADTLCDTLGCNVYMPLQSYQPNDLCYCNVSVCNPTDTTYTDIPVFAILDILGNLYFAPDYSEFNFYSTQIPPGETLINVLPQFQWPSGAGTLGGVNWYAAMTDPDISELFGESGLFTFGWSE